MLLLIYANILLFYIYIVICFKNPEKNFFLYFTLFLKHQLIKKIQNLLEEILAWSLFSCVLRDSKPHFVRQSALLL